MDSQFKTIHPVKYLHDHLAQNIRPDGRQFLSFRPISINASAITQADSSAIFKIGNTTVVCGIKAELTTPKAETPECGYIIPNVELSPLCSSKYRPGPPSEEAQVITKLMDTILTISAIINLKDLCICRAKLVWVLYCDMLCINNDGAVTDACVGAMFTALKALTLPKITYNPETESTSVETNNRCPLTVKTLPVCTTFVLFEGEVVIADPTDDEENLAHGKIVIVEDEIGYCYIQKPGGIPVSKDVFMTISLKSKKRAELVRSLINVALTSLTKKKT